MHKMITFIEKEYNFKIFNLIIEFITNKLFFLPLLAY